MKVGEKEIGNDNSLYLAHILGGLFLLVVYSLVLVVKVISIPHPAQITQFKLFVSHLFVFIYFQTRPTQPHSFMHPR